MSADFGKKYRLDSGVDSIHLGSTRDSSGVIGTRLARSAGNPLTPFPTHLGLGESRPLLTDGELRLRMEPLRFSNADYI